MARQSDDILVEISEDKLPKLAAFFEKNAPWAPYLVTFVYTGLKWRKIEKYKRAITFWSPNNCWEEDGTVIILTRTISQDIFVFTLDENCVNLYKGLSQTRLLNYENKTTFFYAVNERFLPTVKKYIEEKKIKISVVLPCFLYGICPEEAKKFSTECPPDVYIKRLDLSHVKQINDLWPTRFPNSEKYVSTFIETQGGLGVFLKSTNELVAWMIRHAFGNLVVLQTEEEHKRKGYAKLVTRVLAKEVADDGFWAFATVIESNLPAIGMFEQLGFRRVLNCTFLISK